MNKSSYEKNNIDLNVSGLKSTVRMVSEWEAHVLQVGNNGPISWQSWKAATRNPVEALRYE